MRAPVAQMARAVVSKTAGPDKASWGFESLQACSISCPVRDAPVALGAARASENLPGDQLQCTVTRARCHLADGETRTRISPLGKRRECAVDGRTGYGLVMISTERGAR